VPEIARHAVQSGLVASISDTTVWRWLHQDAIRPWQHRCWIFPRDPDFAAKAGRLLDLYEGVWQDQPLREDEFVLSADEKTSIQARARIQASEPPRSHHAMKVKHEYERRGAWAYLAAWDVHQAKVFGRCEAQSGIAPLIGWSNRSWDNLLINRPGGCFGLWTTALPTAARKRSGGCKTAMPI